jgi:hypothetical protein
MPARIAYFKWTRAESKHVMDSITGEQLETATRLIHIGVGDGGGAADSNSIRTCGDILVYLLGGDGRRAIMLADAGTGKSWMMQQLMNVCAQYRDSGDGDMAEWAPIFIPVQAIANALHSHCDVSKEQEFLKQARTTLTVDWVIDRVVGPPMDPAIIVMLREAVASERAVFVFDGVDEAGLVREVVEDFILEVGQQHRIMVTSRPEGVRQHKYEEGGYLQLTLQPLTVQQQQGMINRRLTPGGAPFTFFANLLKFMASRLQMDTLFAEHFPEKRIEQVKEIEGDEKQYACGGVLADTQAVLLDCAARAKPVYDAALIAIAKDAGLDVASALKLAALKGTSEGCVVDGKLLKPVPRLVQKAWELDMKKTKQAAKQAAEEDAKQKEAQDEGGGVAQQKVEVGQVMFRAAVTRVMALNTMLDDATVHTKMEGLSEVKDVVRGLVECDSEEQMLRFIEGVRAYPGLTIVRLKNCFANLGPTHYRRIGLNVRVDLGDGGSHVAEIQVHHRAIHCDEPDHTVYEYFRSLFVGSFDSTMDEWIALEKRMQHLEAVMRVPVLMSLLIVCMDGDDDGGAIPEVPETTPALYHTAMEKLYKKRHGGDWERMRRLLRAVFTQNQLQRQRQFGHADVVSALQAAAAADGAPDTYDELQQLWDGAVEEGTVPFVKTLVKPTAREGEGGNGGGRVARKATATPRLRLHPVRRGARQLYDQGSVSDQGTPAPHRTRVSFTLFSLGKWSEASLDATTTSTGTVWWPRSSDMCILGANMTASPRAPRPAASPASGPRMTSFVQNSFLTGLRQPRTGPQRLHGGRCSCCCCCCCLCEKRARASDLTDGSRKRRSASTPSALRPRSAAPRRAPCRRGPAW